MRRSSGAQIKIADPDPRAAQQGKRLITITGIHSANDLAIHMLGQKLQETMTRAARNG